MNKIRNKISVLFTSFLLMTTLIVPINILAADVIIQEGTVGTISWELNDQGVMTMSGGSLSVSVEDSSPGEWLLSENLDKVKKIVISDSIKLINFGPVNFFKDLASLETIVGIEKLDLSEATEISYMFMGTESLKSLDLTSWNVDNVVAMTSFLMLSGVEDLDISTWNTANVGQASSAFMTMNNPLRVISLGANFTLPVPTDVEIGVIPYEDELPEDEPRYTGNWIGVNTHQRYHTYEFMTSYVEVNKVPDTYIWEEVFEVSFNSNGGSNVASQNVFSTYPATEPTEPSLEGHDFNGWYTDDNTFVNAWNFETVITEDIVLHAKWTPVANDYTITYDSMGGSVVSPETVKEGTLFTEPIAPKLDGSTFVGWYVDNAFQLKYDFSTPATKDITVYAKWETIEEPVTPPVTPPTTPILPSTGIGNSNVGLFMATVGILMLAVGTVKRNRKVFKSVKN